MKDNSSDHGGEEFLSDSDPIRRAQIQMRSPLPKRFYKEAMVVAEPDGTHSVRLDDKPVRTPGRALLALPTNAAARLVAGEFAAQKDVVDPTTMPVLRLANTAIDGVGKELEAVMDDLARYSSSDLLFYRAEGPRELVARQAERWDPVLDWARSVVGARFWLAEGVMYVEQPRDAIEAVAAWIGKRNDPFRLAAMHVMTTLMGSALLALAVEAGAIEPDTAWAAAHVDEDWNIEQWGVDDEALARRVARKADYDAAVALISALSDPL